VGGLFSNSGGGQPALEKAKPTAYYTIYYDTATLLRLYCSYSATVLLLHYYYTILLLPFYKRTAPLLKPNHPPPASFRFPAGPPKRRSESTAAALTPGFGWSGALKKRKITDPCR
jgi:hypothetical protein